MATRRIDYLECPRCMGRDFYVGIRQVGTIGTFGEMGDSGGFIGGQRPVEKKMSLCRQCGEKPVWKSRMSTAEEDVQWAIEKSQMKATLSESAPTLTLVILFYGACAAIVIWCAISIFS
jgi:hypothetical protein